MRSSASAIGSRSIQSAMERVRGPPWMSFDSLNKSIAAIGSFGAEDLHKQIAGDNSQEAT
jgi:hypothetical protein